MIYRIGILHLNFIHPLRNIQREGSTEGVLFLSGLFPGGGGSQIWSGYGCKARPPTGWGIRWEHRLKKWGVIGWEHDFRHSVREKYKNMWGHRVRAKSSQKSRVFGWLVFSILDCKITKVKYIVFFPNASFSNHGALSDRLNEKIWVFGWELMQL